jgi:DMSO/TMAO reductase YedYZ molybdopterin-dependent catalytic subunit
MVVYNLRTCGIRAEADLRTIHFASPRECVFRHSLRHRVVKTKQLLGGVSAQVIKDLSTALPEAKFVLIHAEKGFTTNLSMNNFLQPDVLFTLKHNGEIITAGHGYPVRLVVPRLYFWKSAKWVTGVEFMAKDRRGFWESHGYHNRGDPWLEERYSY